MATASQEIQLVLSSPLSRAVNTADMVFPSEALPNAPPRIILENLREINGWLLNAKRLTKAQLRDKFPAWDFSLMEDEEDVLWQPDELEDKESTAERGYQALLWTLARDENCIAIAGTLSIIGGVFTNN